MPTTLFKNEFAQVEIKTIKNESDLAGIETLTLSHQHCQAKLSLYGGQVLSFKPRGYKNIFWLSDKANVKEGNAIRGGVPICWPWFGPIDKSTVNNTANTPVVKPQKHGFARQLNWQVKSLSANSYGITVILTLSGKLQHPAWPQAFKLEQVLFFGKNFTQSLTMENLSTEDAQYSAALHNYFLVSKPEQVSIESLTGVEYLDQLTQVKSLQQESVSCVGEIDRKYYSRDVMTIKDRGWQRKIKVISSHCQEWVLWNPGTSLASTMDDVHAGGEHQYVCLEPANTAWQPLPAGKKVMICQEIYVEQYTD